MNLLDTCVNEKCRVISVDLNDELKDHLCAMGLCPNATVCVKRYGWFKSSVQVQIGQRLIALGKDQARGIEIRVA
ncbi:MAG: ferrous iron transport protein A [Sulfuricurvum sp.]|uniref:FeoA family protein n=1 Tax=Sulfuricurvum sp. TaxID=2025608 RepID=UPI00262054FA|nr:FeoA family protein [Sulfuricurvum sp.]MDD2837616.1 FeoA family protein [Sulfuricurvum sp.]MDD3595938.1 FeoA family protein [Sulfuricurvum sp.]